MGAQSAGAAAWAAAARLGLAQASRDRRRDHGGNLGGRPAGIGHPVSDHDEDRGLARERTALAWTRKVLGFVPVILQLGRLTMREAPGRTLDRRMRVIMMAIIALGVVALIVSFLGR